MTCAQCGANVTGKFCGTCGMAMEQEPPVGTSESVVTAVPEPVVSRYLRQPSDQGSQVTETHVSRYTRRPSDQGALRSAISKLRGMSRGPAIRLAVTGAIVVTVIVAGIFTLGGVLRGNSTDSAGGHASDSATGTSIVPAAASANTPHEICTLQVYAIAANIHDNPNTALQQEMLINGQSDPFFKAGEDIWYQVTQEQYRVGVATASEHAKLSASTVCTDTLNDVIRPNYPTDGTHP